MQNYKGRLFYSRPLLLNLYFLEAATDAAVAQHLFTRIHLSLLLTGHFFLKLESLRGQILLESHCTGLKTVYNSI